MGLSVFATSNMNMELNEKCGVSKEHKIGTNFKHIEIKPFMKMKLYAFLTELLHSSCDLPADNREFRRNAAFAIKMCTYFWMCDAHSAEQMMLINIWCGSLICFRQK